LKVYFPYEGIREIAVDKTKLFCEQINGGCSGRSDDLAVVALSIPYKVLPIAELGDFSKLNMVAEKMVVGFGLSDGSLSDNGIKREGRVKLNECKNCDHTKSWRRISADDNRSLCFDFTDDRFDPNAVNLVGSQPGDSGGPMLDASYKSSPIVGLASGISWACSDRNHSENRYVDLTNPQYRGWITKAFGEPPCRTALTYSVEKLLEVELARLDLQNSQDSYQFTIRPGSSSLIVTMNHEVGGWNPEPSDLELVLDIEADCTRYIGVEVCTVDEPAVGLHTVSVKRIHKQAAYQLTAIALYDNPSAPASETAATGTD
jgi:hypothetical protein